MHYSDFFSTVFEYYEPLSKIVGVVLAIIATVITALKKFFRSYSKAKDKNVIANIRYLEDFGKYLSDDDKLLISNKVANEILQNVLKSRIAITRDFISYLYVKLDDKTVFNDILKVQGGLKITNGKFFIESSKVFGFAFWFERFLAVICLLLFLLSIFASLLFNIKYENSSAYLIFLMLALGCEIVGLYCLSATPGERRVKEINSTLEKVNVKPEWL